MDRFIPRKFTSLKRVNTRTYVSLSSVVIEIQLDDS